MTTTRESEWDREVSTRSLNEGRLFSADVGWTWSDISLEISLLVSYYPMKSKRKEGKFGKTRERERGKDFGGWNWFLSELLRLVLMDVFENWKHNAWWRKCRWIMTGGAMERRHPSSLEFSQHPHDGNNLAGFVSLSFYPSSQRASESPLPVHSPRTREKKHTEKNAITESSKMKRHIANTPVLWKSSFASNFFSYNKHTHSHTPDASSSIIERKMEEEREWNRTFSSLLSPLSLFALSNEWQ
jgi:hypothetical protein